MIRKRLLAAARTATARWRPMPPGGRIKREECRRTKHDSIFSDWKVLIGPSDWEDYSLKKAGVVQKYRIHNLPANCSSPGLYELGVALTSTDADDTDSQIGRHVSDKTVIVYLGHSVNVRKRLQYYGRAGSHLDHESVSIITNIGDVFSEMFSMNYPDVHQWALKLHSGLGEVVALHRGQSENARTRLQKHGHAGSHLNHRSISSVTNAGNKSCLQNGAQVFNDVFSKGGSIVYRWAPMSCKEQAAKMEAQLLEYFDYAWNKHRNGAPRHEDILLKLEKKSSSFTSTVLEKLQSWKYAFCHKKLGIESRENSPHDEVGSMSKNQICGVAISDGYIRTEKLCDQRKGCTEHRVRKITGTKPSWKQVRLLDNMPSLSNAFSGDGSAPMEKSSFEKMGGSTNESRIVLQHRFSTPLVDRLLNSMGTTLCEATSSQRQDMYLCNEEEYDICGIILGDGSVCSHRPVPGRKRCILHKWQRIQAAKHVPKEEEHDICGIILGDGSVCSNRPVPGRKRCILHKWQRIKAAKHVPKEEEHDICGIILSDGSVCSNRPVSGRKRCVLHRWQRIEAAKHTSKEEEHDICGIILGDGSTCSNRPVPGRKRCILHKWQRIQAAKHISKEEEHDICGIILGDGSTCSNRPIPGRKRCVLHKWQRIEVPYLSSSSKDSLDKEAGTN